MNESYDVVDSIFRHYFFLSISEIGHVEKLATKSVSDLVGMLEVAFVANAAIEISEPLHETGLRIFEVFGDGLLDERYQLPRFFRARLEGHRNVRVHRDHLHQFVMFVSLTWELESSLQDVRFRWVSPSDDLYFQLHNANIERVLSTPDDLALLLARPKELASPRQDFLDDVLRILQFVWTLNELFDESEAPFQAVAWNYHARLLSRPALASVVLNVARRIAPWTEVGRELVLAAERTVGVGATGRYRL